MGPISMRQILIYAILLFSAAQVFGQDSIAIDIDTTIFNKHIGYTTYQSESTDAVISCIVVPMGYQRSLPGIQHESNPQVIVLYEKELTIEDHRVYIKKGKVILGEESLIVEGYLIEVSDEKSLMVIGRYDEQYAEIVGRTIENAATSARLIE